MRINTHHGWTDCEFEDFVAVEPRLQEIRDDFLAKKINADEVHHRVSALVGRIRFNEDFDRVVGERVEYATGPGYSIDSMMRWEDWLNEQPIEYRRLYYTPEIVAKLLMEDEG